MGLSSMFSLGKRSEQILNNANPDLQKVVKLALAFGIIDFSVIESFRDKDTQNRYHQQGKSKLPWPHGKHNKNPSDAVDLVPYINGKISWDSRHCTFLAGVILAAAKCIGVEIRWGGNWDMDGEPITDQEFQDLVHYETTENGR